jgi:sulfate adenylyltransferase
MSKLVSPHGGTLVDGVVTGAAADKLRASASGLARLTLDERELADFELIATGAASPIRGFLTQRDYERVRDEMRLESGVVWPIPLTLAVEAGARPAAGDRVALQDRGGRLWGLIDVAEVFERDPQREALAVYGTGDAKHPGVAYLLGRPSWLIGGRITALPLPTDLPMAKHRLAPRQLRAEIETRGWARVAGFQTRNPIHRAHEHLTRLALEVSDGLVIHALVGETKEDDVPAAVRFRVYELLVQKYYPPARTLLAAFPAAMRYAGPREALFHALVRKNYGITSLIVGRDHAGVGNFYPPMAAQEIFDRFTFEELGVAPLKFEPTFFCRVCDTYASTRTCAHEASDHLQLSGTRVRQILREGGDLPHEFTRPEVAEVLREHYRAVEESGPEAAGFNRPRTVPPGPAVRQGPADARQETAPQAGFIVWLTGLSGAGKTTLAKAVLSRINESIRVDLLDGDIVRAQLWKELGFSKADRDTNIDRIGSIARLLARHGIGVLVAAISPYAAARDAVRQKATEEGIPFVEVFVSAPLEVVIQRDVKGLYKKALAGEIPAFTGVSDPYEAPVAADFVARTDVESVEESVHRLLALLRTRGLVAAEALREVLA